MRARHCATGSESPSLCAGTCPAAGGRRRRACLPCAWARAPGDDLGLAFRAHAPPQSARARKAPIDQPLPGYGARALDDLLEHRRHLRHVAAGVAHLHPDDDLVLARCGQLYVERWPVAAVAHLHHPRVGIRGAGSCLLGLFTVAPRPPALRQLLQRGADALLALLRGTLARSLRPAAGRCRIGRGAFLDVIDQLAGLGQKCCSRLACRRNDAAPASARTRMPSCATRSRLIAPAEASAATLAVSTSSIKLSFPERKVVERVVIHRHATADPAVGVALARETGNLRPLPTASSVAYSHSANRIRGSIADRPALLPRALIDSINRLQVPLDVAPTPASPVILTQQRLQVRGAQFDLPAVGLQQPRRALPA